MAIFIAARIVVEIGKKNARNAGVYERMYNSIDLSIQTYEVNASNYEAIKERLKCLAGLTYKNKEMTEVLTANFNKRFNKSTLKRMAS